MNDVIAEIKTGKVRGTTERGVYTFKGIPYGESTAGSNRFMAPVPAKSWTGIRDATSFGPSCPQRGMQESTPSESEQGSIPQNEDCLVINVWTPAIGDGGKRPVMVWFHGGGWAFGSGSEAICNGANLSKRGDVVVVTMNHRISILGFLNLEEIGGEKYAASGMNGMLDLVLALEWVRDNIAAFGGDPDNVTIFGESGGARKVSVMLAIPSAKGLFHKAIIESSPALHGKEVKEATKSAEKVMAALGLKPNEVDKLQQLPADRLLDVSRDLERQSSSGHMDGAPTGDVNWMSPAVGNRYLPAHPFDPVAAPTSAEIPLIIGTNKDELALGLARSPDAGKIDETEAKRRLVPLLGDKADHVYSVYHKTRPQATPWDLYIGVISETRRLASIRLVERKLAIGSAPVFMYLFTWETDVGNGLFRACHSLEIPFVFDIVDDIPLTGSRPDKYELAAAVSDAWIAFARSGNPSHPGIPEWPKYTVDNRDTMILDVPCKVMKDPYREELDAWGDMEVNP
jgi:para-nitrobenzyl esterase